eukprot:14396386-Heterocapsa_arctica.AAC.1
MHETYERREAQWDIPQAAIDLASSGKGKRGGGDAANSGIDKKGGGGGKGTSGRDQAEASGSNKLTPGDWAHSLCNGGEICARHNMGN